jgi:hypothetical protein
LYGYILSYIIMFSMKKRKTKDGDNETIVGGVNYGNGNGNGTPQKTNSRPLRRSKKNKEIDDDFPGDEIPQEVLDMNMDIVPHMNKYPNTPPPTHYAPQLIEGNVAVIDSGVNKQHDASDVEQVECPQTLILSRYNALVVNLVTRLSFYLTGIPNISQESVSEFVHSFMFGIIICCMWLDFPRGLCTVLKLWNLCWTSQVSFSFTAYVTFSELHNMFIYSMACYIKKDINKLSRVEHELDKTKNPIYYLVDHITNDHKEIIHFGIAYPNTENNRRAIYYNMMVFNVARMLSRALGCIWLINFNFINTYAFVLLYLLATIYGYMPNIILHMRAIGRVHMNSPSGLDLTVNHDD